MTDLGCCRVRVVLAPLRGSGESLTISMFLSCTGNGVMGSVGQWDRPDGEWKPPENFLEKLENEMGCVMGSAVMKLYLRHKGNLQCIGDEMMKRNEEPETVEEQLTPTKLARVSPRTTSPEKGGAQTKLKYAEEQRLARNERLEDQITKWRFACLQSKLDYANANEKNNSSKSPSSSNSGNSAQPRTNAWAKVHNQISDLTEANRKLKADLLKRVAHDEQLSLSSGTTMSESEFRDLEVEAATLKRECFDQTNRATKTLRDHAIKEMAWVKERTALEEHIRSLEQAATHASQLHKSELSMKYLLGQNDAHKGKCEVPNGGKSIIESTEFSPNLVKSLNDFLLATPQSNQAENEGGSAMQ